jgi:hypothetical protein
MSFIFRQFLQEQIAQALKEQGIAYPSHRITLELASKTKEGDCYLAVPNIEGRDVEETAKLIKEALIKKHRDLIKGGHIEKKSKRNQAYLYLTFQAEYYKAASGAFMDFLTGKNAKESLSLGYLHLLAAMNRLSINKPEDDNGVDVVITAKIGRTQIQSAVQLKSTTTQNCTFTNQILTYHLENKNYNELIVPDQQIPLILALLVLPEDENTWLGFEPDSLILRSTMYWVCLAEEPKTTHKTKTPIQIPIKNVLTVNSLAQIMNTVCTDFLNKIQPNHKTLLELSKGK